MVFGNCSERAHAHARRSGARIRHRSDRWRAIPGVVGCVGFVRTARLRCTAFDGDDARHVPSRVPRGPGPKPRKAIHLCHLPACRTAFSAAELLGSINSARNMRRTRESVRHGQQSPTSLGAGQRVPHPGAAGRHQRGAKAVAEKGRRNGGRRHKDRSGIAGAELNFVPALRLASASTRLTGVFAAHLNLC